MLDANVVPLTPNIPPCATRTGLALWLHVHQPSRGPGERKDFATFKWKITRPSNSPSHSHFPYLPSLFSFILFPLYELPLCLPGPIPLFYILTKIRFLLCTVLQHYWCICDHPIQCLLAESGCVLYFQIGSVSYTKT